MKDGNTHEQVTTYTYDSSGRLGTVADATDTFTYGYLLESNLVETLTSPTHTVTNTYETSRNVLDTKKNEVGSTLVSGYDYTVNRLGQRTDLSQTGTAFATARSIAWGYDSLGQATKADSSIPGLDRAYQYDMIGNRLKSADSLTLPANNNYTVNALNQYTAVDSNSPTYDDDGNATAYPLPSHLKANSTLVWDAENRLTGATVSGIATSYAYDSQSRRIATVTGATTTLTIYDGWNPITKYSGATLDEAYLWGMDLSGSMQGAGGVAGLLSVNDGNASYYPTYDGNGNVSEYLNSAGSVQAHYEYEPFGKTTVATGTKAQDFAHRFSTKPLDTETGLYYYGYRYYDPVTGRWPSRDPIGERGGVNLYGFVRNDGVIGWDYLGLEQKWWQGPDPYQYNSRTMLGEDPNAPMSTVPLVIVVMVATPVDETVLVCKGGQYVYQVVTKWKWVPKLRWVKAPKKPALPDSYWKNKKALDQVTPGTKSVTDQKPSSRSNETYERTTHYDEYGRSTGQTHRTSHGEPAAHPNPHHYQRNPATGEQVSNPNPPGEAPKVFDGTHPDYGK